MSGIASLSTSSVATPNAAMALFSSMSAAMTWRATTSLFHTTFSLRRPIASASAYPATGQKYPSVPIPGALAHARRISQPSVSGTAEAGTRWWAPYPSRRRRFKRRAALPAKS
jgi:hypothetical protein